MVLSLGEDFTNLSEIAEELKNNYYLQLECKWDQVRSQALQPANDGRITAMVNVSDSLNSDNHHKARLVFKYNQDTEDFSDFDVIDKWYDR